MPTSSKDMAQTMIDNLPEKTGKNLGEWLKLLRRGQLQKHGQIVQWLKTEHGVTHGFANLIAQQHLAGGKASDAGELVAAQYSGPKAALRPIYEAVTRMVEGLGKDIEVSPKKTCVSYRRNKQFALIQASTRERVDLGINLKGTAAAGRLEPSGSFNAMVSHRVRLADEKDVNAELKAWLKKAYDAA